MSLSLQVAEHIVAGAKAKAAEIGLPVSIAVVDDGGYLVAFARTDGGRWINVDIAIAKAVGAAAFRTDASNLGGLLTGNPQFVQQLLHTTAGRLMIDIGSVVILDVDGGVIGAVAVSGASAEQDEVIARAGLAAAAGG